MRAGWRRVRPSARDRLGAWAAAVTGPATRPGKAPRPWLQAVAVFGACLLLATAVRSAAYGMERAAEARVIKGVVSSFAGKRVLVDPGHGGIDPGALGPGGIEEDELTLQISLKLAEMLRAAGATVLLTRADGNDLSGMTAQRYRERKVKDLWARVEVMNRFQPDLVVSIHCNAYPSPTWRGAQAFYDGKYHEESKRLAVAIQDALRRLTPTNRWANGNINHLILKQAPAPAVTVEVGFLSNPDEARLLTQPEYQQRVAFAVFLGMAQYLMGAAPQGTTVND
ncbi:MAG: N-acetylmuramoyl-L-alanine amidase [Clostridia bacterium]|nr:N-acetylmuramoyl-L-alanine amidase [Clostridia bacterium]